MMRISGAARITLALALLSVSILLAAKGLGLVPDRAAIQQKSRITLCESLAINCSLLASRGDLKAIEANLNAMVQRNDDIRSAALRRADGRLQIVVGDHESQWTTADQSYRSNACIYVPILAGNEIWGRVEVRFDPLVRPGLAGLYDDPFIRLAVFCTGLGALLYYYYLRRILQHLDPTKVVPARVRAALDTLAEGLLLLDNNQRIVLANKAFAGTLGSAADDLVGRRVASLPWSRCEDEGAPTQFPWETPAAGDESQLEATLKLTTRDRADKIFKITAAPVVGDDGKRRGVLASFNDITLLEDRKEELLKMLINLRQSRQEVEEQNEQLKFLATRDPLTSCLNRRSFFEDFEKEWNAAMRHGRPLGCIMVDIDHFKAINDNHGHATGDEVLRTVSGALLDSARDSDLVCRYGGEEFCLVLPGADVAVTFEKAERLRLTLAALEFSALSVTASLGVSALSLGAADPHALLDQADKSLYVAKRTGRNRVMRWDQVPPDCEIDPAKHSRPPAAEPADDEGRIPYHAVNALMSALAYRDAETAAHSARVADLCAAVARRRMSISDAYVVEIAALLHDIGKIGVPDSILLKPGRLTAEEWKVMGIHDRIGVEIVRSAFNSEMLVEIIYNHHAMYGGDPSKPHLPSGDKIPLGARILTIADAYDAMVSDRVYRRGRPAEEAIAELRRCAGRQFDPRLVEEFVHVLQSESPRRNSAQAVVTQQTALSIGQQVERLARAVDSHDVASILALAGHLHRTAEKSQAPRVAELAAELGRLAEEEPDLTELVNLIHELMDIVRTIQSVQIGRAGRISVGAAEEE